MLNKLFSTNLDFANIFFKSNAQNKKEGEITAPSAILTLITELKTCVCDQK